MPHIAVDPEKPGIIGLFDFRPETAKPLGELVEVLLRGPNSLSRGERELIGAVVSRSNDCSFCSQAHGAFAAAQLEGGSDLVERTQKDPHNAPLSDKMRALLRIALTTRDSGKSVTAEQIAAARSAGATETEIHDTVLIAAVFSLFTRYVDGLGTEAPDAPEWYAGAARQLVQVGYPGLAGAPGGR
ncbi:carboxymuconolactone decarboxylase family protein [Streptomyces triculaminicus]|uniref:carboxymuconolactone decarboxylase family protein n=1 Tax=Streptomyces triculaminicus TaxID=2816232 RepID=UPI0037D2DC8E